MPANTSPERSEPSPSNVSTASWKHILMIGGPVIGLAFAWMAGGLSVALLALGAALLLLGVWNLWTGLQVAIGVAETRAGESSIDRSKLSAQGTRIVEKVIFERHPSSDAPATEPDSSVSSVGGGST